MAVLFEITPACLEAAGGRLGQLIENLTDKMEQSNDVREMLDQLFDGPDAQPVQVIVKLKRGT